MCQLITVMKITTHLEYEIMEKGKGVFLSSTSLDFS